MAAYDIGNISAMAYFALIRLIKCSKGKLLFRNITCAFGIFEMKFNICDSYRTIIDWVGISKDSIYIWNAIEFDGVVSDTLLLQLNKKVTCHFIGLGNVYGFHLISN